MLRRSQGRVSQGIEPIARASGPHFKFSLAAYSYRDLLLGNPPKLTLDDFIDDCAKFGLDGTELTSYYFPENPSEDFLRQLKATAFRRGLDISGTAVGNDFCFPPGEKRTREIDHVKQLDPICRSDGCPRDSHLFRRRPAGPNCR